MAITLHNYDKHTWQSGEVITLSEINAIQDAIEHLYSANFYGLGNINDGDDLNNFIETGRFFQSNVKDNYEILNSPVEVNTGFSLIVLRLSTMNNSLSDSATVERILQILITSSSGRVFLRTKGNRNSNQIIDDNDWYDWHQLAQLEDIENLTSEIQENLLPPIYYYEHKYGKDFIRNGVRWTVNEDRSITATQIDPPNTGGRENNNSYFYLTSAKLEEIVPPLSLNSTIKYTIVGRPNVSGQNCSIQVWSHISNNPMPYTVIQDNDQNWKRVANNNESSSPVTFSIPSGRDNYVSIRLGIINSFNFSSVTFKPMLVKGEYSDEGFQVSNLVATHLYDELKEATKIVPSNLIPSKYYHEIRKGVNFEHRGITWTLNDDGSITAKGSANTQNKIGEGLNSYYYITGYSLRQEQDPIIVDNTKTYYLQGCPNIEGCTLRAYTLKPGKVFNINFYHDFGDSTYWRYFTDSGNGCVISNFNGDRMGIRIRIEAGTTLPAEGITFYPMLVEGNKSVYDYVHTHKSINDNLDLIRATEIVETARTYISKDRKEATETTEEVLPNGIIYNTDNYFVFPRNYIKHTGTCYCSNFLSAVLMGLTYEQSPYGILKNIEYSYTDYDGNTVNVTGADYRTMHIVWSSARRKYLNWNDTTTPSDHTNFASERERYNELQKANALKEKLTSEEIVNTLDDYKQYVEKKPWSFDLEKYHIYHASTLCEWLTLAGTRLSFTPQEYKYSAFRYKPVGTNFSNQEDYNAALKEWRRENVRLARVLREAGVRKGDLLFTASSGKEEPDRVYLGITHIVIITRDPPKFDQEPDAEDFDESLYKIILNCRGNAGYSFLSEVTDSNGHIIMDPEDNTIPYMAKGNYQRRGIRTDYLTRQCGTIKAICRPLTGDDAYGRYLEAAEAFTRIRTPDSPKENLLPFPYFSGPSTGGGVGTVEIPKILSNGTESTSTQNRLIFEVHEDGSITVPNPVPPRSTYQFYFCRRQDRTVELKYNTRYNFKVIPTYKIRESSSNTYEGRLSVWRLGDFNKRELDKSKEYHYERGRGHNYIKIPDFNIVPNPEYPDDPSKVIKESIDTSVENNKLYLEAYLRISNATDQPVDYSDIIFYPSFQEGYGIGAYQSPRISQINLGRTLGILETPEILEDVEPPYLPGSNSWSHEIDPDDEYNDQREDGGPEGNDDETETDDNSGEGSGESSAQEENSFLLDQGTLDSIVIS